MKIFLCLIFISLLPCNSFSQEGEKNPLESLRETLLYGIESEILEAVKNIKGNREERLNKELETLLSETVSVSIRLAVLDYFTVTEYSGAGETALELLEQTEVENAGLIIALIKYLSEIKFDKAGEYFTEAIDEQNSNISLAAIKALGSSKSKKNGQLLLDRLQDEDYPDNLKPELILALGELVFRIFISQSSRSGNSHPDIAVFQALYQQIFHFVHCIIGECGSSIDSKQSIAFSEDIFKYLNTIAIAELSQGIAGIQSPNPLSIPVLSNFS
ncbi:MAG: hypothetical protein GH155_05955 [Spirochaeta sp.]|nr:hypothetical protein [Spirochaeta sp.]